MHYNIFPFRIYCSFWMIMLLLLSFIILVEATHFCSLPVFLLRSSFSGVTKLTITHEMSNLQNGKTKKFGESQD
ncbi:hypothetical protein QQ045_007920 [Rhodiola kirilowii]